MILYITKLCLVGGAALIESENEEEGREYQRRRVTAVRKECSEICVTEWSMWSECDQP